MNTDKTMQNILAFVIVGSFIGMMVFWNIIPPPDNPNVLGMMQVLLGLLGAAATAVTAYYFGSSTSSKEKDNTIGDIAKQQTGTPQNTGTGNGSKLPPAVVVESPSTVTIQSDDGDLGDPLPTPKKS